MGEYRIAQICLKGHVVTEDISNPKLLEDFCSKCGSQTITACPSCSAPIRGEFFVREFISLSEYELPKYCYKCGKPYPWTQKAIDDAAALIEEMSTLETAEKDTFKAAVSDVMFIFRLSAKGTDRAMKHGAASATFLLLLYLSCRAGILQNPWR